MSSATISCRIDSYTNQTKPTKNYADGLRLSLDNTGAAVKYGFVHFPLPDVVKRGATVTSATLKLYPKVSAASTTVEARRVTSAWKERTITYNDSPTFDNGTVASVTATWADEVALNVTSLIAAIASSGNNYGLRLTTTATARRDLHSSEAANALRPVLELVWSKTPSKPGDLAPSGGRVVSTGNPRLSYAFKDLFGDQTQSAQQVQVRRVSDLVTVHDSGTATTSEPVYTLSGFTLVSAVNYDWRVRAQDGDGLWSPYSDWTGLSFQALGTTTITNPPSATPIVQDTTPPLTWTSPSQVEAQVYVDEMRNGKWKTVDKLTRRVTSLLTYTPPRGVITSQVSNAYRVRVWTWDAVDRQAISGAPDFSYAERVFSFQKTTDTAAVLTLTATPHAYEPRIDLAWTRTLMPDEFHLIADGKVVATVEAPDVFVSGTSYALSWWGAIPRISQTYEVAAVVNDKTSSGNPTAAAQVKVGGIWLVHPDTGLKVRVMGREAPSEEQARSAATLYPIGRATPVHQRDALRGVEGSQSGTITTLDGVSADTYKANLLELDEMLEPVRFVRPDINIPIHLTSVSCSGDSEIDGWFAVSWGYEQIDEFKATGATVVVSSGYTGGY